jgi:hypothetical protein
MAAITTVVAMKGAAVRRAAAARAVVAERLKGAPGVVVVMVPESQGDVAHTLPYFERLANSIREGVARMGPKCVLILVPGGFAVPCTRGSS